jgi:Fic family protein
MLIDIIQKFIELKNELTSIEWANFYEKYIRVHASYGNTVIEGTNVTVEDVEGIFEGKHLPPYFKKDELEVMGYDRTLAHLNTMKIFPMSESLIKYVHKLLMIEVCDRIAGEYRIVNVRVGSKPINVDWRDVPILVSKLVDNFNNELSIGYGNVETIFTLASKFHIDFENIHPFRDGNGRTGRLLFSRMMEELRLPPLCLSLDNIDMYYVAIEEKRLNLLKEFFELSYKELIDKMEEEWW